METSRAGGPVRRWAPRAKAVTLTVVDVLLAVAVFVATADQGSGVEFGGSEVPGRVRTLVGVAAGLAVVARRRSPYPPLAVGAAALAIMSAPWALMVGVYTLSVRARRPRWYGALVAALALAVAVRLSVGPGRSPFLSDAMIAILTCLIVGGPVLLGLWIGTRRALVASLRERAERLEREQLLRAEQATAHERARIAREMHDVVAHRVSLLVLHAGALEVSLGDAGAARQAGLIRETGREALAELRQLLEVLRERGDGALLGPQPTLADLDGLVRRSRDAGMEVAVAVEGERRALPGIVERAAYRVVQEALTNVHKHAGNAATEVRLCYGPRRLEVVVRNAKPTAGRAAGLALPGGHGLIGTRERVALLGGTVEAGPRLDGGFELRASIPTEAPP